MPSSNQVVTGQPVTKCCNKCGVDLVIGDNWHASQKKTRNYICTACHKIKCAGYSNKMTDAEYLHQHAARRAKANGREFTLTVQDVEAVDGNICPYLQIPMKRYPITAGTGGRYLYDDTKTLDRIDSAKGYVPGNVIVCSWRANNILGNATLPEIALIAHNFRRILLSTKPTNQ